MSDRGDIQAIIRAAAILRLVCKEGAVSAQLVSDELALERTTAHRYLSSLRKVALLARPAGPPGKNMYKLGPLAFTMASAVLADAEVFKAVRARMPELAQSSGGTAVICLAGEYPLVVADVAYPSDDQLLVRVPLGYRVPPAGAQSIVTLAHHSDSEQIVAALDPIEQREVRRMLGEARGQLVYETRTAAGLPVSAMPLFQDGRLVATIAIIAPPGAVEPSPGTRRMLEQLAEELSTVPED